MSRNARRLATALIAPLALLIALPGAASASDTQLATPRTVTHYATFEGPVATNGRSGSAGDDRVTRVVEAGICTEYGTGLRGARYNCYVTWSLDINICKVGAGMEAGSATYTSSENSTVQVPLRGVGAAGAGHLEGTLTIVGVDLETLLFHVTIDAGSFCGAAEAVANLDVSSNLSTDSAIATTTAQRGGFGGHADLLAPL